MKHKYLLIGFILLQIKVFAQDYTQAVGIRAGMTSGMAYKYFMDDENGIEFSAGFQRSGIQLYIIKQYYQPIFLEYTQQLFFFFGAGGHFGYSLIDNEAQIINGEKYYKKQFSLGLGIDADIGLEYHILKFPVAISLDYKPYFEVNMPIYFRKNFFNFTLSVYYTF